MAAESVLRSTETAARDEIVTGNGNGGIASEPAVSSRSTPPQSGTARPMAESTAGSVHIPPESNRPAVTADLVNGVTTRTPIEVRLRDRLPRENLPHRLRHLRHTVVEITIEAAGEGVEEAGAEVGTRNDTTRLRLHHRNSRIDAGEGAGIDMRTIATEAGMSSGSLLLPGEGVSKGRNDGSKAAGGEVTSLRPNPSPESAMTIMEAVTGIRGIATSGERISTIVVHADAIPLRWEEDRRREVGAIVVPCSIRISAAAGTLVVAEAVMAAVAIVIVSTVLRSVVGLDEVDAVAVRMIAAVVVEDVADAGGFPTRKAVASTRIVT